MIFKYNRLISLKTNRENAFADIDVYLKKRIDLIPNLVETVKSYAKHESELFENVTKARTSCMNATNADEKIESENMLS
jgi:LemA protein